MTITLTVLVALGWSLAVWLYIQRHRQIQSHGRPAPDVPVEPLAQAAPFTRAVLLNHVGQPESCRMIKGPPPETYSRAHGKQPATMYRWIGSAAVYQATTPRQQQ